MTIYYNSNQDEIDITIRLFKNSDAQGVIDCIRAEYGDTYFKRKFYDPAYLVKINCQNETNFIVAETDTGIIAGVIALKSFFPGEMMCELATEIFKKEFRRYHLAESMIQFAMGMIEERCYSAMYALPVTFHSVSQRLLKRNGMIATGFILSVFISDKVVSSYEYGRCIKHSQGIQIKALEKRNAGNIYISEELNEIATNIYKKLVVDFKIITSETDTLVCRKEKTMLYHVNDSIHNNCAITILKIGADVDKRVNDICSKYKDIPLQTFNVFLNMNDSNSEYAYEKMKDNGFFFTGFKALCSDNEYMVMHNNNGIDMFLEDYVLSEEFEELMQLIRPFIK